MFKSSKNNQAWYFLSVLGLLLAYSLLGLAALWSSYAEASEKRIVAIDGSLTEIIYALGDGDKMVGRDITTTYPPEALKLPDVGYMRSLSAEGILSLKPNLVIATTDAKPQSVLTRLNDAGVRVELIDNDFTLEGVKIKIRQVAKVLDRTAEGEALIKKVQASVDRAMKTAKEAKKSQGESRALFVLNMRGGNMMVAGQGSRANKMLELAEVGNPAASQFKNYKPLTAEAAIQFNPQYIITMSHGLRAAGGRDAILDTPALQMTEAGKKKQLLVMDDGFLTFGPRLGDAIENLVNSVYGK